jgi:hypothetical protein
VAFERDKSLPGLSIQVFRFEVTAFMNDAVNVHIVANNFVHDPVGIHANFPYIFVTDFWHGAAKTRQVNECLCFFGNIQSNPGSVAF